MDIGSSYLPSEVVAALLLAQLEAADEIQNRRNYIWNAYQSQLSEWTTEHSISIPHVPSDCCHPAHLYYLLMPDFASRTRFIEWMKSLNITCVFTIFLCIYHRWDENMEEKRAIVQLQSLLVIV